MATPAIPTSPSASGLSESYLHSVEGGGGEQRRGEMEGRGVGWREGKGREEGRDGG